MISAANVIISCIEESSYATLSLCYSTYSISMFNYRSITQFIIELFTEKTFQALFSEFPALREGADKRGNVSIQNTDYKIYYLCSAYAARADLRKRPDRKKSPGIVSQKRALKCSLYGRSKLCATNHACQWIPRRPHSTNCRDQSWRQCVASPASRSRSTRNVGRDLI